MGSKGKSKKGNGGEEDESSLERLNIRLKALKDLGIPAKSLKEPQSELTKLKKKKDSKTKEEAVKKLEDSIAEKWNLWLEKQISLNIEFARGCLDALREKDEKVSDEEGMLSKINEFNDKGSRNKSLDMAEELMISIQERLSRFPEITLGEAWSSLSKAFNAFEEVAGREEKLTEAKKHFKKTVKLIEKGKLEDSIVYSNLLYTSIQSHLSEDTAKDRFKAIQNDIKGLMDTMDEFKKYGLENTSMEKDLDKLENMIKGNKISDAQSTIKRINKNVSRVEKEFFRRKGNVSLLETGELVDEYGSLIDLGGQVKKLENLKKDQTKMSPKKFMEESSSLLEDVRSNLFDNFEGQVNERLEGIDNKMENVNEPGEREAIKELREKASSALESRDITEAMDYLSLAESMIVEFDDKDDLIKVKDNYETFLSDYEILLNEDIELEDLKEEISEIESMFLQDDILETDIMTKVSNAEESIKGKIVEVRSQRLNTEKQNMFGLLNSLNVPNDRLKKYEGRFSELESMLDSLEEDEYKEEVTKLKDEVDGEISNYFRGNYETWAKDIQSSLVNLKGRDIEVNQLQTKLEDASRMYRERDYLHSGQALNDLKVEIENIENNELLSEVEEQIDSAEFLFDEASRSGVDISEKKKALQSAKELLNKGEIQEASRLVDQIEGDVKNIWKEKKRSTLESDLQELKGVISESDELGLDISDIGGLIDEAEVLFQEDRLDEVTEVVTKARETLDSEKSQYYSQSAMESIKNIKNDISSFNNMGINTMESETLLIEAERLFMDEQYDEAYGVTLDIREQLNLSKETHFQERVPSELDSVMKRVGRLEVMGLETDAARDYIEQASRSMEQGDLIGSWESVNKAKEISDEIYKGHISLTIPETIVDVQKQIEETSMDGLEIDDIQGMLQEAEGLFQNEDYDTALDTIEKAQETFNSKKKDYYRSQYEENLDTIQDIMGKAQGIDNELELSRDNLNMARDAYERGDYESSSRLMNQIMKYLDRSMTEKESSKRREVVQTYYDEVRTLLMITEGENIDTTEERKIFQMAGDHINKGEFEDAEKLLEGVKLSLNEKRVNMKKKLIESSIKTSEILLQNMKEMGVNTDKENKLIDDLKQALRDGDLDLCDDINQELTNALQKNQGPVLVQKVQRDITELRARIVEANRANLDVSGAQKQLSSALELFELGDVEASQEKVHSANEILDEVFKEHKEGEYKALLRELMETVEDLKGLGIPYDDEEELISSAGILFEDGNIDQAKSILEMANIGAVAKLNSFRSTTAESYIEQITQYLSELDGLGIDTEDLVRIFQEGLELHQNGQNEKAISKFSSILEIGEEVRTLHEIEGERERFVKLKKLYDDLKTVGFKGTKKITRILTEIKEEMESEIPDIEAIRTDLDEVSKMIEKKKEPYMEPLAKKHLQEARVALSKFSEDDLEDQSLNQLMKETGDYFRNKDYSKADDTALLIIKKVEDYYRLESGIQLKEEISQVKQMLTRLKTLGSNVSNAENLLTRAEHALDESRIENAEKLIHSVRQSIQDIVKRNMRETALETIEFTDAMIHYLIDNFSGITKTIKPAEEKLDEARGLFKEKKFKAAKSISEEARILVEKLELQNITQFLYVFRSMQAEEMERDVSHRLSELSSKGLDTTKAMKLFQSAKENFEKDEFDKGRQMVTLARIMISELDQQSLRDKAFDELNNAHVEILAQKKKGGQITSAYKTYNNAKEAFSLREYKKTILLAKRAHFQARKSRS